MKIILTGASGFVGKNLTSFLIDNVFLTYCISLRNSDWKMNFYGDAIIHLAGKAHRRRSDCPQLRR